MKSTYICKVANNRNNCDTCCGNLTLDFHNKYILKYHIQSHTNILFINSSYIATKPNMISYARCLSGI